MPVQVLYPTGDFLATASGWKNEAGTRYPLWSSIDEGVPGDDDTTYIYVKGGYIGNDLSPYEYIADLGPALIVPNKVTGRIRARVEGGSTSIQLWYELLDTQGHKLIPGTGYHLIGQFGGSWSSTSYSTKDQSFDMGTHDKHDFAFHDLSNIKIGLWRDKNDALTENIRLTSIEVELSGDYVINELEDKNWTPLSIWGDIRYKNSTHSIASGDGSLAHLAGHGYWKVRNSYPMTGVFDTCYLKIDEGSGVYLHPSIGNVTGIIHNGTGTWINYFEQPAYNQINYQENEKLVRDVNTIFVSGLDLGYIDLGRPLITSSGDFTLMVRYRRTRTPNTFAVFSQGPLINLEEGGIYSDTTTFSYLDDLINRKVDHDWAVGPESRTQIDRTVGYQQTQPWNDRVVFLARSGTQLYLFTDNEVLIEGDGGRPGGALRLRDMGSIINELNIPSGNFRLGSGTSVNGIGQIHEFGFTDRYINSGVLADILDSTHVYQKYVAENSGEYIYYKIWPPVRDILADSANDYTPWAGYLQVGTSQEDASYNQLNAQHFAHGRKIAPSSVVLNLDVEHITNHPSGLVFSNEYGGVDIIGFGSAKFPFYVIPSGERQTYKIPLTFVPNQSNYDATSGASTVRWYNRLTYPQLDHSEDRFHAEFRIYSLSVDLEGWTTPATGSADLDLYISGDIGHRSGDMDLFLDCDDTEDIFNLYIKGFGAALSGDIPLSIGRPSGTNTSELDLYIGAAVEFSPGPTGDTFLPLFIKAPDGGFLTTQDPHFPLYINAFGAALTGLDDGGLVDLYLHGRDTVGGTPLGDSSGNIPFFIKSTATTTGDMPLYLEGGLIAPFDSGATNTTDLYIIARTVSSGDVPLYMGGGSATGTLNLYLLGEDSVAFSGDTLALFTWAHSGSGLLKSTTMFVQGAVDEELPLFIKGPTNFDNTANMRLYIRGKGTINQMPLFISNKHVSETGYIELYTAGPSSIQETGSMPLFIQRPGNDSSARRMDMYISSPITVKDSSTPLFLDGETTVNNNTDLFITAKEIPSGDFTLYTHGF